MTPPFQASAGTCRAETGTTCCYGYPGSRTQPAAMLRWMAITLLLSGGVCLAAALVLNSAVPPLLRQVVVQPLAHHGYVPEPALELAGDPGGIFRLPGHWQIRARYVDRDGTGRSPDRRVDVLWQTSTMGQANLARMMMMRT